MAWAENNYIETRFVKGMNCAVEPHTLDRDTGELPDIMNMVCRTQGLRTRKGWVRVDDLSSQYGVLPTNAPSGLFLFEPVLPEENEGGSGSESGGGGGGGGGGIGGGGSIGGGGGIKPKPTEDGGEEEPSVPPSDAWNVVASTGTVMPYVPFELTITNVAENDLRPVWYACYRLPGMRHTYVSGTLVQISRYVWEQRNKIVRDLSRGITGLVFRNGYSGSSYGECQVGYALYSFVPNMPTGVSTGTRFYYTITCVHGGSTVTGYKGGGAGVVCTWKFYDENNNRVSGTASSPMGSWSNGVYSSYCVVKNTDAHHVVLEVEFLGEVNTASANVVVYTAPVSIEVTRQLHVFGGSGVLNIEVTDEYSGTIRPSVRINAFDSSDESVTFRDWFEDENGNLIDWTQGWTHEGDVWSWSGTIRAKSDRSAETIALVPVYKESEGEPVTVQVLDGLAGTLNAPESVLSGVAFDLAAYVASEEFEEVPRLPTSGLYLRKVSGSMSFSHEISTDWDVDETDVTLWAATYSCALTGTGSAVVGLYFRGLLVASREISAMAARDALIEAINERYEAKGSSTRVSANDSASIIRNAAIDAIGGYAKGDVASNGGFTPFNSSNHEIPETSEEEWEVAAYEIVRSAKIRHIELNYYGERGSGSSGYVDVEKIGDDYAWSAAISRAKSLAISNFSWSSSVDEARSGIRTDIDQYDDYKTVTAYVSLQRFGLMVQSLPNISCKITAYGGVGKYMNIDTFDKFGYNIPDYGQGGVMGTWTQPSSGSIVRSGYLGINPSPKFNGDGERSCYYEKWRYATSEYSFKHK